MNVFQLIHEVNRRVNGDDEEKKLAVTFLIINKLLLYYELINGPIGFHMGTSIISSGKEDDKIKSLVNELDNESESKMLENVHNHFAYDIWIARTASPLTRALISTVMFGIRACVITITCVRQAYRRTLS